MPKLFYDFVEGTQNLIEIWLNSLDTDLRARMHSKIRALMTAEDSVAPHMLTDTKEPHIKELRVNGKEALRLLLCLGPLPEEMEIAHTFLFGATERDKKYVPKNALMVAEANRQLVIQDQTRRVRRRNRKIE